MNSYLKIILSTITLLMLLSCNYNADKRSNIQNENAAFKRQKYVNENVSFADQLSKNRECMTDSQRVNLLVTGDFFESKSSKVDDFLMYLNYLLDHSYEELDEAITQYTYSMFTNYPSKFIELDYYRLSLNKKEMEDILRKITILLSSELIFRDSIANTSEADFAKMFPYLKEHNCIKYFTRMKVEYIHK